ncbi:MAG: DUF5683 domain-containing protein [Saprospiraceae bacterium]
MKIYGIILLVFMMGVPGWAQQSDSLATTPLPDTILVLDSAAVAKKGVFAFFSKDYPSPKKAAYLSLALPGAGQIYNKRWWKLPLVYGAIGGVVYAIDYNQGWHREFRTAFNQKINDMPVTNPQLAGFDVRTLRILRDRFDKNTQLSYIGLVVVYALQSVEAFVDAHLKTFNVDEDLTLHLKPSLQMEPLAGQPTLGIGVALKFD